MPTKILFFTDLHASVKHGLFGMAFIDQVRNTLSWIGEVVAEHEIDYVFFLGDVFHVQQAVDTPSIHVAVSGFQGILERMSPERDGALIVVPGNHDMYRKDGEWRSTEVLRDLHSSIVTSIGPRHTVHVVNQPEVYRVPMPTGEGKLVDELSILLLPYSEVGYDAQPANFIAGHLPVQGALFNPKDTSKAAVEHKGVSPNFGELEEVDPSAAEVRYVGGHYHHPQRLGLSLIVGACCYHSYKDFIVQTPRGCAILALDKPRPPLVSDFFWLENPHTKPVHTINVKTRAEAFAELEQIRQWTRIPEEDWNLRMLMPSQELEHLDDEGTMGELKPQLIPNDPLHVAARMDISDTSNPIRIFDEYRLKVPPDRMEAEIKQLGDDFLRQVIAHDE